MFSAITKFFQKNKEKAEEALEFPKILILEDINNLQKVKSFMLKAVVTNDEADANLGVAIDKINTVIKNKEDIITDFERMEEE